VNAVVAQSKGTSCLPAAQAVQIKDTLTHERAAVVTRNCVLDYYQLSIRMGME